MQLQFKQIYTSEKLFSEKKVRVTEFDNKIKKNSFIILLILY